jgi:hypothetical protein
MQAVAVAVLVTQVVTELLTRLAELVAVAQVLLQATELLVQPTLAVAAVVLKVDLHQEQVVLALSYLNTLTQKQSHLAQV